MCEDPDLAVFGADVYSILHQAGRTGQACLEIIDPDSAAGGGIQTVQVAVFLGDVNQTLMYRGGADGRAEIDARPHLGSRLNWAAEWPDQGGSLVVDGFRVVVSQGNIPLLGDVQTQEVAPSRFPAPVGGNPKADVQFVPDNYRRANELAMKAAFRLFL